MAHRKPIEFVSHPLPFPDSSDWRAVCRYVVDGDTLDVLVDQGFNTYRYQTLRLIRVDARELRSGSAASKAQAQRERQFVADRVLGKPVAVRTFKDTSSFGRYLADVWYWDQQGTKRHLNTELADFIASTPAESHGQEADNA